MQGGEQKGRWAEEPEPEGEGGEAAARERLGRQPGGGGDFEEASLAVERERAPSLI